MKKYILKELSFLNRKKHMWLIFFSVLFSVVITFSRVFIYSGNISGSMNDNYARKIIISDFFVFVFGFLAIYMLIIAIVVAYNNLEKYILSKKEEIRAPSLKKQLKIFLIIFLVLFICWLPYLLSNMPGAIFADGFLSITQVVTGVYNNHHPILYTFFTGVFIKIGILFGSMIKGIALYTLVQMLIMISIMAYFIIWLYKKNISRGYLIIVTIFTALFPLFPFYSVTFWKDTLFSLALFNFVLIYTDIFISKGEYLNSTFGIINYCITAFSVCFLRNNGIYIYAFSLVILIFIYRKLLFKKTKRFAFFSLLLLILIAMIQGPVYKTMNLSTEFVENLAMPTQQIFAVIAKDGKYTEEDKNFISKVWDIEEIKKKYTPCNADTPKWYMNRFDDQFLERNKIDFFRLYFRLLCKNPVLYAESFGLQNIGFWNINASGPEAYVQVGVWPNNIGIEQQDYFLKIFGFSFNDIVYPKKYISSGLLFWFMISSASILILHVKKFSVDLFVPYIPVAGAWATIMVASPLGISFRYMYVLVLIFALIPVIPSLAKNKNL